LNLLKAPPLECAGSTTVQVVVSFDELQVLEKIIGRGFREDFTGRLEPRLLPDRAIGRLRKRPMAYLPVATIPDALE